MHRFSLAVLALAAMTSVASAAELTCDGPLAPDSTEAALIAAYGAANVVTGEVDGPEGTTMLATTVFPNDPQKRSRSCWWDEDDADRARLFHLPPGDTAPQGVMRGMTVKEVQALNGGPFELQGFWWDYGGYADFTGGRLGAPEEGCIVSVRFAPAGEYPQDLNVDAGFRRPGCPPTSRCSRRWTSGSRRSRSATPISAHRKIDLGALRAIQIEAERWFPGPAWARGSKGNTVRRTHQGPNP